MEVHSAMKKAKWPLAVRVAPIISVLLVILFYSSLSGAEASQTLLWEKLRSGDHFVLMRHALAPGTGDPPSFEIDKCETQRNLSQRGREQARDIGALFRENGIHTAQVYSSQWCRCLDTARLLNLGDVTELPIINSFFQNFENEKVQTAALVQWLNHQALAPTLILVTHQVNITAFTGIYPSSGEIVVVHSREDGTFAPIGTIATQ